MVWGIVFFLCIAGVIAAVWYGTRLSLFTITTVTIEGGETIDHAVVHDTVIEILNGTYARIIPHTFTYLYPQAKIVEALSNIPRMHTVTVIRDGMHTIKISFTEYHPFALWCDTYEGTQSCYFIDETGYAFAQAPDLHGGVFVRHILERSEPFTERSVFDANELHAFHTLLDRVNKELSLRITDIVYTRDGDAVLYIHGGGRLMMARSMDFDLVFRNLVSTLNTDEFKHLAPGTFDYIDLRFGNKIFVKEEIGINASTTPLTATTSSSTLPE
jgi:hypothetical protein